MNESYITLILNLLKANTFYNETETIDIAKGKYKYPSNWKEVSNMLKRNKLINNGYKKND